MRNTLKRRTFLKSAPAVAAGLSIFQAGRAAAGTGTEKAPPGKLPYKIVYNQDDSAVFIQTDEPIEKEHVLGMVDEVARGGADCFLACVQNHKTSYPSDVWEPIWYEYKAHGTVFGRKGESWIRHARQAMRLAEMGYDYPELVMKRCREKGIAPGISIRMDDAHYRGPHSVGKSMVTARLAQFYQNTDLYLKGPDTERMGGSWALNYEKPEVREHYLALIRELVERYDMEVLDLDFMRHPPYFDRKDLDRHCETMTGFLHEVHTLCHSSGRNISLMARVPSTPANCLGLGLDVGAWARERLVNGIALGMKNCTGWEAPVDAFREITGENVSIYPGTERQAGRTALVNTGRADESEKASATRWTREMFRGFAAGQLANGADGIYLFNFFVGNSQMMDVLSGLAAPERLVGVKKAYRLTTYGTAHTEEADLPMQVPVTVPARQSRKFEMLLASEPEEVLVEAVAICDRMPEAHEIWLQMNDTPLGHATRISREKEDLGYYSWHHFMGNSTAAVFRVPAGTIIDGWNNLTLRNEGEPLMVLGLAVRIID